MVVIHEEIDGWSIVFNVPGKDRRAGGLEYDFLKPQAAYNSRLHMRAAGFRAFSDVPGFDHEHVGPDIDECFASWMSRAGSFLL